MSLFAAYGPGWMIGLWRRGSGVNPDDPLNHCQQYAFCLHGVLSTLRISGWFRPSISKGLRGSYWRPTHGSNAGQDGLQACPDAGKSTRDQAYTVMTEGKSPRRFGLIGNAAKGSLVARLVAV